MLRSITFFVAFVVLVLFSGKSSAHKALFRVDPSKGYDVKSYNATIWLDRKKDSISGSVQMRAIAMGGLTKILQHAKFLQIDSVFVDGILAQVSTPDSTGAYEISGFENEYEKGSVFTVRTCYHGKGMTEGGIRPWGGVQDTANMMFAMGVGFTAPFVSCTRYWMPCYDEPDDKADSVILHFIADTSGIVVSNGLLTGYLAGTEGGKTNYYEWTISHPIATYLLTFAFGPFEKLSIPNPLNIPFDVYGFAQDTTQLRALMEKRVVPALVFFDSLFGKYPFEKVGYVVAPIGSMEHQTMITLVRSALGAADNTAVHELAHQWWGDEATCFDFNDAWLSEGFASFSESLFQERFFGKGQYRQAQHSRIMSALAPSEDTIPLFDASMHIYPRNNYPSVIYNKGAAVLGMLRSEIGDSAFFSALRFYLKTAAYSNVSTESLKFLVQFSAQKDMRLFFQQWIYGTGHPALNVLWSKKTDTVNVLFEQTQDSPKPGFFKLPVIVEARSYSGKRERHELLLDTLRYTETSFINSFPPDTLIIDPDGALLISMNNPAKPGIWKKHIITPPLSFDLYFTPNSGEKNMQVSYNFKMINAIANQALLEISDTNGTRVSVIDLGTPQIDSKNNNLEYFFSTATLENGIYSASLMLNDQITIKGKFVIKK